MTTPEKRAENVVQAWWDSPVMEIEDLPPLLAAALRAYGDERAAQEREACARLADSYAGNPFPAYRAVAVAIAADIRARKDSP